MSFRLSEQFPISALTEYINLCHLTGEAEDFRRPRRKEGQPSLKRDFISIRPSTFSLKSSQWNLGKEKLKTANKVGKNYFQIEHCSFQGQRRAHSTKVTVDKQQRRRKVEGKLAKLCNLFIHEPFTQIRHVICHAPDPKLYASNYRQSSDQNQRQFRRNYRDNSCLFASFWMVCCKFLDRVGAGKFACSLPQSFLFTFR